jgi:hypothetical protein
VKGSLSKRCEEGKCHGMRSGAATVIVKVINMMIVTGGGVGSGH